MNVQDLVAQTFDEGGNFAGIAVQLGHTEQADRGAQTPQPALTVSTPTCIGVSVANADNTPTRPRRTYVRHGDWKTRSRPEEDRFWEKVDKTETCWIWMAAQTSGYGYFASEVERYAHRWSYVHLVGPIPHGLHVDHLCRNKLCVNPDHLEPVTLAENLRRAAAFNALDATCKRGHPWNEQNTRRSASGSRSCRACARQLRAERRAHKTNPGLTTTEEWLHE